MGSTILISEGKIIDLVVESFKPSMSELINELATSTDIIH